MFYSIILPTFGRPDEVKSFLESIRLQQFQNFEVIAVDGSLDDILYPVIEEYKRSLDLKYFHRKGLGASESRNLGCENAHGDFVVFIDSDCIVPSDYFNKVENYLMEHPSIDAYGGPDAAEKSFSPIQKAINYAMTSILTTGGIRGKKVHAGKFQLRGFNMGVRRQAFFQVGGYRGMQVGEDIDLSIRLFKAGYQTALIDNAFVYHRRKSTLYKFYRQLYFHGKGRIDLHLKHGDALKPVHLLPAIFIVYLLTGVLSIIFSKIAFFIFLLTILVYIIALLIDASILNKSIWIGMFSVLTAFEMLIAYGIGLWRNIIIRMILRKGSDSKKELILKE